MSAQNSITINYSSPMNPNFSTTHTIPSVFSTTSLSVTERVLYLSNLRAAVSSAQDSVNSRLTTLMEEDKLREQAEHEASSSTVSENTAKKGKNNDNKNKTSLSSTKGALKRRYDETKEEELYGEEEHDEDMET